MKRILLVMLCVLVALSVAACGGNVNIEGTWVLDSDYVDYLNKNGVQTSKDEMVFVFDGEGNIAIELEIDGGRNEYGGTYEVDGKKLILSGDEGFFGPEGSIEAVLQGGKMVLDGTVSLEKQ